jgi:hypothetical protein
MAAVLGDDGPNGRHVPDLMTQRLRVIAMQRLLAIAAGRWFAIVDSIGVIDEGALGLGMSGLSTGFLVGRRIGWRAFEGRWVGRRRLGGVGGVLVEPLLECGHLVVKFLKALLVPLDKSQDGCLGIGRDLLPQLSRDRRNGRHANILRPLEARTSSAGERLRRLCRGLSPITR